MVCPISVVTDWWASSLVEVGDSLSVVSLTSTVSGWWVFWFVMTEDSISIIKCSKKIS